MAWSLSQPHLPNPNFFSRIFKDKQINFPQLGIFHNCTVPQHWHARRSVVVCSVFSQKRPGIIKWAITALRVWAGPKICLNFRKDIVGKNLLQIWTKMTRFQPSSCTCTWANSRSNVRKCGAFFPPEKQVLENSHGPRFLGLGNRKKVGQLVLVHMQGNPGGGECYNASSYYLKSLGGCCAAPKDKSDWSKSVNLFTDVSDTFPSTLFEMFK